MQPSGSTRAPEHGTTVAVVTTYHPEPGLGQRLRRLEGQCRAVIIVDNGSADAASLAADVRSFLTFVTIIENGANLGLARALNQGLAAAADARASWVLMLDQDSVVIGDIVTAAAEAIRSAGLMAVAAVGAGRCQPGLTHKTDMGDSRPAPIVITSGMLLSLAAFQRIGPFREDFFVDYVDIEWCLRARQEGYAILQSVTPTLEHEIGDPIRRKFLGHTLTATNHSTGRRRDITRNRMKVWRRYVRREPRYVLGDVIAFAKEAAKICVLEDRPLAKMAAIGSGIADAIWPGHSRRSRTRR